MSDLLQMGWTYWGTLNSLPSIQLLMQKAWAIERTYTYTVVFAVCVFPFHGSGVVRVWSELDPQVTAGEGEEPLFGFGAYMPLHKKIDYVHYINA